MGDLTERSCRLQLKALGKRIKKTEGERDGARLYAQSLQKALRDLVDQILLVVDSPEYKSVWMLAAIHGEPYEGPTFEAELKAAQRALDLVWSGGMVSELEAPAGHHPDDEFHP